MAIDWANASDRVRRSTCVEAARWASSHPGRGVRGPVGILRREYGGSTKDRKPCKSCVYGLEHALSKQAMCHADRAAGRHDVHRIRGTTQPLLDESGRNSGCGWAQAAPLQLRSVGSRLFTTRRPITTNVLRELCVKIQRERAMCFSCWARRRTSSLQHLFRREARGSSLPKNQGKAAKALRTMRGIGRLPSGVRPERPCELCESVDVVEQSGCTLPST